MTVTIRTRSKTSTEVVSGSSPCSKPTEEKFKYTDGESDEFEFGGSLGAASLIIGFPLLMWYMWIGATYYDGQLPTPETDQTWRDFIDYLAQLVYDGAYPTAKAWTIYWTFFIFEALMFVALYFSTQSPFQTLTLSGIATCPAS
jgi:delta24(24(1))-sterol reductase